MSEAVRYWISGALFGLGVGVWFAVITGRVLSRRYVRNLNAFDTRLQALVAEHDQLMRKTIRAMKRAEGSEPLDEPKDRLQ